MHLEALASHTIKIIEDEQALIRPLNRLATALQNDDPDWPENAFDDEDPAVIEARRVVQASLWQ